MFREAKETVRHTPRTHARAQAVFSEGENRGKDTHAHIHARVMGPCGLEGKTRLTHARVLAVLRGRESSKDTHTPTHTPVWWPCSEEKKGNKVTHTPNTRPCVQAVPHSNDAENGTRPSTRPCVLTVYQTHNFEMEL